jgi:hypothetical protein
LPAYCAPGLPRPAMINIEILRLPALVHHREMTELSMSEPLFFP